MTATAPRFVAVARVEDVPSGTARTLQVDGRDIALVNDGGTLTAVDGLCPHAGGPLGEGSVTGSPCLLVCPWHEAAFDVASGEVRRGPARKRVRTYPVEVTGGEVLVALG